MKYLAKYVNGWYVTNSPYVKHGTREQAARFATHNEATASTTEMVTVIAEPEEGDSLGATIRGNSLLGGGKKNG